MTLTLTLCNKYKHFSGLTFLWANKAISTVVSSTIQRQNITKNDVHIVPDLVNRYIVPSNQTGDSRRKDVEVLTIQPEHKHMHFATETSRHDAPLHDGLSMTSQQQQQQSIGGSV